jgi:hypothetical protein
MKIYLLAAFRAAGVAGEADHRRHMASAARSMKRRGATAMKTVA